MVPSGSASRRRVRVRRWVAVVGVSLLAVAAANTAPRAAVAAGSHGDRSSVPRGATLLPTGRFVRPAGLRYDLGDFSLGLAVAPGGRCAATSDEGWGNGQPVPA